MIRTIPFLLLAVGGLCFWAGWRARASRDVIPKDPTQRAVTCGCRHHKAFHHSGTGYCSHTNCGCLSFVSLNAVAVPNVFLDS